jgi:hypothetical protein
VGDGMSFANAINSVFSNVDAFGNLSTSALSPRIQLQFPYTINTDQITTAVTGSGTATHSSPFAVCSTTAAINSSARIQSRDNLHYRTGEGGLCLFTAIFTTGAANSIQEVGLGDAVNGFFLGYNGASLGINRRSNSGDNYIPQTDWNKDKMNGTGLSGCLLDPTKGNVYKIQYQWLGFGAINFYIESQFTGKFVFVHQIQYTNQNTTTSVLNPSLPLSLSASNTTNNTNIVVKVPSIAAFVEGAIDETGLINSINNQKSGVTTRTNILTIRNNATFGGISNKKFVELELLSIANTSSADALFQLVINTALGGSPSYNDISTNTSVVSFDVAGTTVTGGRVVASFYLNGNTNIQVILDNLGIVLNNLDTLTISATSLGAAIVASAGITWSEQF